MKNLRNIIFLILLAQPLMACNQAIKDFVATTQPSIDPGSGGSLEATGPDALKISPGNVMSSSSSISMKATVTPTDRVVKSGSISAELTIHRRKVSP